MVMLAESMSGHAALHDRPIRATQAGATELCEDSRRLHYSTAAILQQAFCTKGLHSKLGRYEFMILQHRDVAAPAHLSDPACQACYVNSMHHGTHLLLILPLCFCNLLLRRT